MKNLLLTLTCCLHCIFVFGQSAAISTFSTYATWDVSVDQAGNVYVANWGYVYKSDASGTMHVIAGGGSSYGDGGPATAANLITAQNVAVDKFGNIYISEDSYNTLRKVDTAGIITTVAGSYSLGAGYSGDGGLATAARIHCSRVCLDTAGNIYITDRANCVVRKINTSGIITTVAGNGSCGYSGDGGPATAAGLDNVWGIAADRYGNLFIGDRAGNRVRKVDAAGTITTYAGNGSGGSSGAGGPATAANVYEPWGITTDAIGNLYISEWQNSVVSMVDRAGILHIAAGNYTSGYSGDGGPATAAQLNAASDVAVDANGNMYIVDANNNVIRKVTSPYLAANYVSDSFGLFIHHLCSGPTINIATATYSSSMFVRLIYGDGLVDTSAILPGYLIGGFSSLTHTYGMPGTYSIKAFLYRNTSVIDSLTFSYDYKFCNSLTVNYYLDSNSNCSFDTGEHSMALPLLIAVDSNGTRIDTLSTINGLYYNAYGTAGDIYRFSVIAAPPGLIFSCGTAGSISDTLRMGIYGQPAGFVPFSCSSGCTHNFEIVPVSRYTGRHAQTTHLRLRNNLCSPEDMTVNVNFSPKYQYYSSNIPPSTVSGTSATWLFNNIFYSNPVDLIYNLEVPGAWLTPGDTALTSISISPLSGDCDVADNNHVKIDTVVGSWDPNLIEAEPSGHILSGTNLTYTIHFENTGNDTAFNIYVLDTIPNYLNISTFRMLQTSVAKMYVSEINTFPGHTILKFDFPGINLLDSSHHLECHGMFKYSINTLPHLPDCTHITNRAGIYFDYNPVVMTNEVTNIIGCWPSNVNSLIITGDTRLYPNPASDKLTVEFGKEKFSAYAISNSIGVQLLRGSMSSDITEIDISSIPHGVYYITFRGQFNHAVQKFMK